MKARSKIDGLVLGAGFLALLAIWTEFAREFFASVAVLLTVCVLVLLRRSLSQTRVSTSVAAERANAGLEASAGVDARVDTERTEREQAVERQLERLNALETRLTGLVAAAEERVETRLTGLVAAAEERVEKVQRSVDAAGRRNERLGDEVRSARSFTSAATRVVRQEIDELRERLGPVAAEAPIPAITESAPVLSVAIPGYNRPQELHACLQSIVDQIVTLARTDVEIWVTDDQSTDRRAVAVARDFADRHPWVGFIQNRENIGLERNLLAACEPCAGEYLWIVGNDDLIEPGGVAEVLDALAAGPDVLLVAKRRIDRTGSHDVATSGSFPTDIDPGEERWYPTLSHLAACVGLISGLGFISTLVFRRAPFLAVDPDTYLDLSFYPQLGCLLEAFAGHSTLARNATVVVHRTQTNEEKEAEAIGRREEVFMRGDAERNARYFGVSFAALLQRVIDRSPLSADDVAAWPERLFRQDSLVEWLRANAERLDVAHPHDVAVDGRRLLDGE